MTVLLEFSVENYRSIRDLATLSMVATKLKSPSEEVDAGTVMTLPDGRRILRSAVMVGPNGSGKSNLFRAFVAMKIMAVSSARDGQKGDPLPVSAFVS